MIAVSTRRAGKWFLDSGIQEPSGGVARYYLCREARNLPVSNEITGYAASTYAWLYRVSGEDRFLEAAMRTARFLLRNAWHPQLATFPFECPCEGDGAIPPAYFFDCGIIIRGLLAVWRLTGEQELLDVADACGRSMAVDFLGGGAIHPVLSLPDKSPWPYDAGRWSRSPGCYQLKSALAWRDLGVVTGDGRFREWYEAALAMALESAPGFLPGVPERRRVMDRLHAWCYFLEALLPEAQRPVCAAALREGIGRAATLLRDIAPEFARSDVYGQLLRVRLYAHHAGAVPLDEHAAGEEAAALAGFQYVAEDDARLDGGFCFGRDAGGLMPYANPVSTAFCAQALQMWQSRAGGDEAPAIESLI